MNKALVSGASKTSTPCSLANAVQRREMDGMPYRKARDKYGPTVFAVVNAQTIFSRIFAYVDTPC